MQRLRASCLVRDGDVERGTSGDGSSRDRWVGKPQGIKGCIGSGAGCIGDAVHDPTREEPIGHDQDGETYPDDGKDSMPGKPP